VVLRRKADEQIFTVSVSFLTATDESDGELMRPLIVIASTLFVENRLYIANNHRQSNNPLAQK
jgi:hypothetical protein